eukprot:Tbor_TRINITY_DN5966_c3_g5::TRINITY_DN5966_c3_g5_i1::g.18356::m.18356
MPEMGTQVYWYDIPLGIASPPWPIEHQIYIIEASRRIPNTTLISPIPDPSLFISKLIEKKEKNKRRQKKIIIRKLPFKVNNQGLFIEPLLSIRCCYNSILRYFNKKMLTFNRANFFVMEVINE